MRKEASQEALPGTSPEFKEAVKRKEHLDFLFCGLRDALAPAVAGLPANGETKLTITKIIGGDLITVTYKPGE